MLLGDILGDFFTKYSSSFFYGPPTRQILFVQVEKPTVDGRLSIGPELKIKYYIIYMMEMS
jgi:hypothetical protein